MRRTTALLAALALLLTLFPVAALAAPSTTGTWIVSLRAGVDPASAAPKLASQHGGAVGYVYLDAINGFSFRGSAAAASALARNPEVTLVEADAEVWLDTTQTGATWGLDRIDQLKLPLSTTYTYERTGTGVTAYVIDTGILTSHSEFDTGSGSRAFASAEADFVNDGQNGQDCNGHGTHVAGTIGGSTYGVAKAVKLVSVRVFACTGGSTWETIIKGIDWVIGNHVSGPAVANMSLGGGASSSVDTATNNLIKDGVATAVAAGNGDAAGRQVDACNVSPARVPAAMTISATDKTDAKASWANYGNCVDWFAPGVSITSAWYTSTTATNTISGTSMATPHTAGVGALYLEANPGATPAQVRDAIFANTTKDIVTSSSTANNDLLYMGFITGGGGATPPVAAFTGTPTTGDAPLTVAFTDASTGTPSTWSWDFDGDGSVDSTLRNPSREYTAGTYTVSLTVSNADGTDTETKLGYIVVSDPAGGGGTTFGVTLSGSSTNQGSTWTAIVTISAADSSGVPVSGVAVSGDWSNGSAASCTTEVDGACTVSRSQHKKVGSVGFTVTSVTPTQNWDGTEPTITVLKP